MIWESLGLNKRKTKNTNLCKDDVLSDSLTLLNDLVARKIQ